MLLLDLGNTRLK
ncbi:MAG: hypothetical protein KDI78_13190, partial [Xanthomonadales bacterium]|nr:hypothetical protein [Xanthomonadales bacterium]